MYYIYIYFFNTYIYTHTYTYELDFDARRPHVAGNMVAGEHATDLNYRFITLASLETL